MNITITIPDAVANRVIDAICTRFGYVNGGQTKAQFAKAQLIKWLKAQVIEHESSTAGALAAKNVSTSAETEIVIT